jgi:5-(carboxyamino)imidazole ribonucleotide synthase
VVRGDADVVAAARDLGLPIRLKAARGGYDGRRQVVIRTPADAASGFADVGLEPGGSAIAEQELDFVAELSVVVARGVDGQSVAYPVARNRHDDGILVESVAPGGVDAETAAAAQAIGARLAEGLDLVGTLTVELFLLKDGTLAVNELAPRVHNSGHWTIEGCMTSQFEQHVRAICGLPLGPTALRAGAAATVNLLGAGEDRPARPSGLAAALAAPDVHPHLYDKRRVFARRKMGHVTAVAAHPEAALVAARTAAGQIGWER